MLKKIYKDVRDIDLFAGILAENPISTAIVSRSSFFNEEWGHQFTIKSIAWPKLALNFEERASYVREKRQDEQRNCLIFDFVFNQ